MTDLCILGCFAVVDVLFSEKIKLGISCGLYAKIKLGMSCELSA